MTLDGQRRLGLKADGVFYSVQPEIMIDDKIRSLQITASGEVRASSGEQESVRAIGTIPVVLPLSSDSLVPGPAAGFFLASGHEQAYLVLSPGENQETQLLQGRLELPNIDIDSEREAISSLESM
jgi:flagellar basal body rod protein FlgG